MAGCGSAVGLHLPHSEKKKLAYVSHAYIGLMSEAGRVLFEVRSVKRMRRELLRAQEIWGSDGTDDSG